MSRALHVTIVEDDRTTREGLAALISGTSDQQCVGLYSSVEEALQAPDASRADVILLDIDLPGVPGSQGVRLLRKRWPSTEVLMLTVYADETKVFESICNGAVGYLLKNTPRPKLLDAIREAATGGAPMSPEVARRVVATLQRPAAPEIESDALTAREIRLVQLLADGHSYQAAAQRLGISVNTVRSYIRCIYDKLHVHSRSEAVSQALRRRLID
jgi:DNA-binding NarL/FixJ family response regulator